MDLVGINCDRRNYFSHTLGHLPVWPHRPTARILWTLGSFLQRSTAENRISYSWMRERKGVSIGGNQESVCISLGSVTESIRAYFYDFRSELHDLGARGGGMFSALLLHLPSGG
jgi:hypothetical protein